MWFFEDIYHTVQNFTQIRPTVCFPHMRNDVECFWRVIEVIKSRDYAGTDYEAKHVICVTVSAVWWTNLDC